MKLLLDTHAFIWWDSNHEKLSTIALEEIHKQGNTLLFSIASVWEMQIKLQLGKLKLSLPLSEIIQSQQEANNINILPITLEHVLAINDLPHLHKDPFDRLLIAQANIEDASIISGDHIFAKYLSKVIW